MSIRYWLKQIYLQKFFARAAVLGAVFLLFASCSDQGCIDADDFGEYETQTLTVTANGAQTSCQYTPPPAALDDASSQGSGIIGCLSLNNVSVGDETGTTKTSNSGCKGFSDADIKFRNLCISNCIQSCFNNTNASSTNSDPGWTSTDRKIAGKNIGVTIRPGSQVIVRAVGNVVLGDTAQYPNLYVKVTTPITSSQDINWNDVIFDARLGQNINASFISAWGDWGYNYGGTTPEDSDHLYNVNSARKLGVYLIPHPPGYDFDRTKTTEKAGAINVPLLPDPAAWSCDYGDTLGYRKVSCKNKTDGYTSNGYTRVNDLAAASAFPLSSTSKSPTLMQYGGMIRWDGDGLVGSDYSPLTDSLCSGNSGVCKDSSGRDLDAINEAQKSDGLVYLPPNNIKMIGSVYNGPVTLTPPDNTGYYEVLFMVLESHDKCNSNYNVTLSGDSSTYVVPARDTPSTSVTIIKADGTSLTNQPNIILNPGQTMTIGKDTNTYDVNNKAPIDEVKCGTITAIKFIKKYHDLQVEKSGFVKFTSLGGTNASGSCTIKARIVNPSGSLTDMVVDGTTYAADFYEYGPVNTNDPLYGLEVPTSSDILNWSDKVFVRKGQVIRFFPESWNGTWYGNGELISGPRECGIGMAMMIEPRPAITCRGKAEDHVNSGCTPEINSSGVLIGCSTTSNACNDPNSASYCAAECRRPISCTDGTSPLFQRTCTIVGSGYGTNSNGTQSCPSISNADKTKCDSCAASMVANGNLAARNLSNYAEQCFDLENYTGKFSNIPLRFGAGGKALLDAFLNNVTIAKGATVLGSFNGSYGNFGDYSDTGTTDALHNNLKIFKLNRPLSITTPGRLKFFVMDEDSVIDGANTRLDFKYTNDKGSPYVGPNSAPNNMNPYMNNSNPGSGFNGGNGYKITFSSRLEFSNGQWLQVRLCKESSDTSTICERSNPDPEIFSGQPTIINIATPTVVAADPDLTGSNYKFDPYGNITRTNAVLAASDCTLNNNGIQTAANALFYCHTDQYFRPNEMKVKSIRDQDTINSNISKLRLTFKIIDPEIGNCNYSGTNDGIIKINSNYQASSGTGQTCGTNEINCTKQYVCASKYANNSGSYLVNVKVKSPAAGYISSIVGEVVKPVVETMDGPKDGSRMGQSERIYKMLISDPRYKAILNICLVTMFTFWGFGYLMGVSELNHTEIVTRIIKIGIIYLFVGETGWDWFNKIIVKFFKNGTDQLTFMMASSFDNSPDLTNAITNSEYYDKSILFGTVDKVFSMFFSSAVQKKVTSLLFASIFGWAYLFIIYSAFMLYVYAVANAVLLYLTAQLLISILFTLGPIFLVFTLFDKTKEMFDAWLKQLIGFSLQQIFLLTTLSFFNLLMYEVIKMALGYKICWMEVWTINIIMRVTLLSYWNVAALPPRTNAQSDVGNIGNPDGIPSIFNILFIWVVASLMQKFIAFMTDLAASMSGGISASSMAAGFADFAKSVQGKASKLLGEAWENSGGKAIERLDQKFFDSGKLAKQIRNEKKQQNDKDAASKSSMAKAGDKAVSNYKKNNASHLSTLSKARQRKELADVRDAAMTKQGRIDGLSDAKIDALKKDTGLKYEGTNLFGAAFQAAKQGIKKGGSLRTNLEDRKVETSFSHKEGQKALAKMSSEERKKFIDAAASGNIKVKEGALDKIALDKIASTAKSALNNKARIGTAIATLGISEAVRSYNKDDDTYVEATKQLEKEGLVTRMGYGSNWSRSDTEKKLIRDKQKEIVNQRKDGKVKGSKAGAVAELQREAEYLDKKEKIDPEDNFVKKAHQKLALFAERSTEGITTLADGDQRKEKAKPTIKKLASENTEAALNSSKERMDELNDHRNIAAAELDSIDEELDEINEKISAKEFPIPGEAESNRKTYLEKKHNPFKRIFSKQARAENKESQNALKEDPEMIELQERKADLLERKKETSIAINQYDFQKTNEAKVAARLVKEKATPETELSKSHRTVGHTWRDFRRKRKAKKIVDAARRTIQENTNKDKDGAEKRSGGVMPETENRLNRAKEIVSDYEKLETMDDFNEFSKKYNKDRKKYKADVKNEFNNTQKGSGDELINLTNFVRYNSSQREYNEARPQIVSAASSGAAPARRSASTPKPSASASASAPASSSAAAPSSSGGAPRGGVSAPPLSSSGAASSSAAAPVAPVAPVAP